MYYFNLRNISKAMKNYCEYMISTELIFIHLSSNLLPSYIVYPSFFILNLPSFILLNNPGSMTLSNKLLLNDIR